MIAKVKYQIATYSGEIIVNCDSNDEKEAIINKARKILLRQVGFFPLGYESWKIIERN